MARTKTEWRLFWEWVGENVARHVAQQRATRTFDVPVSPRPARTYTPTGYALPALRPRTPRP
jgi:hypothetical protein